MNDAPAQDPPGLVALVADDDRDIRDLVEAKLFNSGFAVIAVSDGRKALAVARSELPDIAVLDVTMPGMSGLDVLSALLDDPLTATIPVILLTARSQEFDVQSGIAIGAADYIVKPFSPRELVARVHAVLDRVAG